MYYQSREFVSWIPTSTEFRSPIVEVSDLYCGYTYRQESSSATTSNGISIFQV
jgi:hypothetical protein